MSNHDIHESNVLVGNSLIDMSDNCVSMEDTQSILKKCAHAITSIGIPACSHAGLEDEGHFEFMCSFYTISCWPFT
jgi:hypothetical protein